MPTFSLPSTSTSWPGPCPLTSAEGECTRRYSNGNWKTLPSPKLTSSTREALRNFISVGTTSDIFDLGSIGKTSSPRIIEAAMQTAEVESTGPIADREAHIAAKLVRACYGNMPGAFIGSAVTASFLVAVLYEKLPRATALTWLAAAYANCLIRLLIWQRFRAVAPRGQSTLRWGRHAVISSAVAGIVWGSSGTLLHIPGALSDQIVVLLVTIGLAFT